MTRATNKEVNHAGRDEIVSRRRITASPSRYALLPHLQDSLRRIVDDALIKADCLGAMIATLEPDHTLRARAASGLLEPERFADLARAASVSFSMPSPLVSLQKAKYRDHLGVRATRETDGEPAVLVSNRLYDLFRPALTTKVAAAIQQEAGIDQVVAIPFIVDNDVAGCLFAVTSNAFSPHDLDMLEALAEHAGATLQSQRFISDMDALEQIVLALQYNSTDEEVILDTAVNTLVDVLEYAGGFVVTLEDNNELLVRAGSLRLRPEAAAQLEPPLSKLLQSEQALARLDEPSHQQNLALRALRQSTPDHPVPVACSRLYDLLCPLLSEQEAARGQKAAHIQRVIAVPFILENEVSGSLMVMSHRPSFSPREQRLLSAVAQQTGLGIRNARLYWRVEEQRRVAQTFARMAFSASAYLHTLRNQIGAFRTYVGLVQLLPQMKPQQQQEVVASSRKAYHTLDEAAEILDHLHEPWRQHPDVPTNVNDCLTMALLKVFPKLNLRPDQTDFTTSKGIDVHLSINSALRPIYTSPEMLTEAFRIVIRNAVDALGMKSEGTAVCNIWLQSDMSRAEFVEVTIRDDGIGISPANIRHIFELGWSTKDGQGMGFGLFWARNFIEGLGGRIDVDSAPQQGATFRFLLPVLADE